MIYYLKLNCPSICNIVNVKIKSTADFGLPLCFLLTRGDIFGIMELYSATVVNALFRLLTPSVTEATSTTMSSVFTISSHAIMTPSFAASSMQMSPSSFGAGNSIIPNLYTYCDNDPINHIDVFGLFPVHLVVGAIARFIWDILPRLVKLIFSTKNQNSPILFVTDWVVQ